MLMLIICRAVQGIGAASVSSDVVWCVTRKEDCSRISALYRSSQW